MINNDTPLEQLIIPEGYIITTFIIKQMFSSLKDPPIICHIYRRKVRFVFWVINFHSAKRVKTGVSSRLLF